MKVPNRTRYYWQFTSMCKGKFIFVLACLLVWTSLRCAVLCASPSSDVTSAQTPASEPPCHHHHQSGDQGKGGAAPCNHTEVQTCLPQSLEKVAVLAGITAMDLPPALPVPQLQAAMTLVRPHDLPPRDPVIRLSVVLRI